MKNHDESAVKFDDGKPQFHHFHPKYLEFLWPALVGDPMVAWFYYRDSILTKSINTKQTHEVLEFGATKYDVLNYSKGMLYSRIFNSYIRHKCAGLYYMSPTDEESGLPHEYHAQCNIIFAQTYHLLGFDGGPFDDRPALTREAMAQAMSDFGQYVEEKK